MRAPQIIYLVLLGVEGILYAILDGQKRTGTYKFASWAVSTLIVLGLLYWGGFFGLKGG